MLLILHETSNYPDMIIDFISWRRPVSQN